MTLYWEPRLWDPFIAKSRLKEANFYIDFLYDSSQITHFIQDLIAYRHTLIQISQTYDGIDVYSRVCN